MIFVTAMFDIDPGIGDYWYIKLSDKCVLEFTDVLDKGDIDCFDEPEPQIPNVYLIQQIGDTVCCKTTTGEYYLLDMREETLDQFETESELRRAVGSLELRSVSAFYSEGKWAKAGMPFVIVGLVSLLISGFAVWMLKMRIWRRFAEKTGITS